MTSELRVRRRLQRLAGIAVALAGFAAIGAGCAESSLDVGARPENEAGVTSSFTPDPDAGDGSLPDTPRLLCLGTECPFPYATCASEGDAPVYKCQHDLLRDNDNCGSCGTKCQIYDVLAMRSSCVNGECVAECIAPHLGDCNGRLEDGCETSLLDDPKNCGACGNACPPGVTCRLGTCGCAAGLTECSNICVDLQSSNAHCGACGDRCTPPDDAAAPPPNSEYGCVAGECGKLRCTGDNHTRWADCNGDLLEPNSDGCEIDVGANGQDPENCGGCGIKCAPGQICRAIDDVPQCICKPNEEMCGTAEWPICADIRTDTEHCGACGYVCPRKPSETTAEDPHQIVSCKKGMCAYDCAPGWADCNDNPLDGCETNLMVHGANCGACGKRCDTAAGQPCVQGVCLEVECDAGGPPR